MVMTSFVFSGLIYSPTITQSLRCSDGSGWILRMSIMMIRQDSDKSIQDEEKLLGCLRILTIRLVVRNVVKLP